MGSWELFQVVNLFEVRRLWTYSEYSSTTTKITINSQIMRKCRATGAEKHAFLLHRLLSWLPPSTHPRGPHPYLYREIGVLTALVARVSALRFLYITSFQGIQEIVKYGLVSRSVFLSKRWPHKTSPWLSMLLRSRTAFIEPMRILARCNVPYASDAAMRLVWQWARLPRLVFLDNPWWKSLLGELFSHHPTAALLLLSPALE